MPVRDGAAAGDVDLAVAGGPGQRPFIQTDSRQLDGSALAGLGAGVDQEIQFEDRAAASRQCCPVCDADHELAGLLGVDVPHGVGVGQVAQSCIGQPSDAQQALVVENPQIERLDVQTGADADGNGHGFARCACQVGQNAHVVGGLHGLGFGGIYTLGLLQDPGGVKRADRTVSRQIGQHHRVQ